MNENLFSNPNFRSYPVDAIPLARDLYIVSEKYAEAVDAGWSLFFNSKNQDDLPQNPVNPSIANT